MVPDDWLDDCVVLLGIDVQGIEGLAEAVTEALATRFGVDPGATRPLLVSLLCENAGSLGGGVALPSRAALAFGGTRLVVVTTLRPVDLGTLDGRAPDVFFFLLSTPEQARAHMLRLAHLVHLEEQHGVGATLRTLEDPEAAKALLSQTEGPAEETRTPVGAPVAASNVLAVISIRGEQPVDALLVELVELGLSDSVVLEAQSLQEALSHEVPLFAGFADIFGDPGGRRVLVAEVETRRLQALLNAVKRVCADHRVEDVWVGAVPLHTLWRYAPGAPESPADRGG